MNQESPKKGHKERFKAELEDVMKWSNERKQFPSNVNEVFVVKSESADTEFSFRFLFSTPILLKKLSTAEMIHISDTYYQRFQLVVLGVNDTGRFLPLLYAYCSHGTAQDFKFIFESTKNVIREHLNIEMKPAELFANGETLITIGRTFHDTFESAAECIPWCNNKLEEHIAILKRINTSKSSMNQLFTTLAQMITYTSHKISDIMSQTDST